MVEEQEKKTSEISKKITAREAVLAAVKFYQEVTASDSSGSLEEVENKGDGYWYITLGFSMTSLILGQKKYRIFKVDEEDGSVESMKIRD